MESHLRVEISPRTPQSPAVARIGGAEFPIVDFAVENDPESGAPMLSVVLAPDSLAIGEPPADVEPEPTKPAVSSWGDGSHPDPREGIPGWEPPSLGGQVAGHAERKAFAEESVRSRMNRLGLADRCDLRTVSEAFRRLVLGGEGGNAAVTA